MKILLVDNYDSFVYNIVGLLRQCREVMDGGGGLEWDVVRNDEIPPGGMEGYDAVILSPGPGIPSEAGDMMRLIGRCVGTHAILGVCLGCQAIAEYFGAGLCRLPVPRHGHRSRLEGIATDDDLLGGLAGDEEMLVGRYHSWVIDGNTIGDDSELMITSRDEEGNIMSVSHRWLPVYGVQFHPESINTPQGIKIMQRFIGLSATLSQGL